MQNIFTIKHYIRFIYIGLFGISFILTSCKNEEANGVAVGSDDKVDASKYDLNLTCSNGYVIHAEYNGKEELDLVLTQDTLPPVKQKLTLSPAGTGVRYRSEDRSVLFWANLGDYSYEVNDREICKCYDLAGEPIKSFRPSVFEDKLFAQSDKYPVAITNFTPLIKFEQANKAAYYDSAKVRSGSFELKEGIIQILGTNNDTLMTLTVRGASHLIDQNNNHWTIKP
jgi:hypothetical protein